MRTKLFFTLLILIISGTFAISQEKTKTSFAVLGGANFQNFNGTSFTGDKLKNDMLLGYHGGINIQIPIAPEFFFQPGLLYSTKGMKKKSTESTTTTKIGYIEMPLNMVYKAILGKGYFMLGFGPYLSYGISGSVKTEGSSITLDQDIIFKNMVESGGNILVPYYKAFDAGANIFIGYEMVSGMFLQLNSQLGMLGINSEYKQFPNDKTKTKNTGFGLSAGYRF